MTAISISPISSKERIQVIDILRGIALLGILFVNVHEISNSWYVTEVTGSAIDRFAQYITDTFFLNKFYTLFSFLFGLGMAIQMIRAEQKGVSFIRLYSKRLFWLLVFGLVHAIFIWDGDILATYALIGIFLLLLRNLNPKMLIILAVILVVAQTGVNVANMDIGDDVWGTSEYQGYKVEQNEEINFFRNATYAEITQNRLENTLDVEDPWLNLLAPFYVLFEGLDILGAFLFGLAVGKLGWFTEIESKLPLWKKLFYWAFPIGLAINMVGGYLTYLGLVNIYDAGLYEIGMVLLQFGAPALVLGYISGVVLLSRKTRSVGIFASAGKMALSVYLTQSIILTLIFYSYGLGLFNTIGIAAAQLLALTIFALQVLISILWMRNFRFGPFEWLWRSLTYRKMQLMKL